MSVYVDQPINPWKGKKWCHLTADSEKELHDFAVRLGLKTSWFQPHRFLPHYDVTESKRSQAIKLGAIEISTAESGRRVREARMRERNNVETPS